jgi:hypothetical protein
MVVLPTQYRVFYDQVVSTNGRGVSWTVSWRACVGNYRPSICQKPGGMRTSLAKKFTKCAHETAAISRSRATIGYCVEIKSRKSVSRASSVTGLQPCERGFSVDEPDAVDPDPGAALNAIADPGRTRRVDSSIACAGRTEDRFFENSLSGISIAPARIGRLLMLPAPNSCNRFRPDEHGGTHDT